MLHEILLSLWGCSTNVSQMIETDSVDLDKYLHPGEQALLNKILDFVKKCNVIRNFIYSKNTKESVTPGLYIRALFDGMDQALEPFRKEIIELENTVLNDNHTPLSLILCSVEKYTCLFSLLHSIIREIRTQKFHGCKLLQCLHQRMHTGIPEINVTLELMAHSVHIVFYKHLTSWLLYGHLEDPHKEFFIQKISDCEKALMHEDRKNIDARESINDKKIDVDMWDYNVQMDILPSYIKPSLANKILTIGQTVIMFGNDPRQKKDFNMIPKTENSVWGDKEYKYFRKLQNLQAKSVFNIVEFDRTINELKQCVTELLWHVAVEEAQLMQQLRLVKEFFLMGRGDLFLELIKLTTHILNKAPTSHTSRDINLAFQMALRKIHLNDESAIDSFNFVVPALPSENEDVNTDGTDLFDNEKQDPNEKRGWGMITLKYKVVWPLHLLFNPVALNDYNTLFRFLLRVKKTQIELWNLWSEHMHHKDFDIGVIQLRNNLIFIVDNLQYYLQVDVMESQYAIMEVNMKNTRNFEDIQKAHSMFLANVMSQTFLLGSGAGKKNPVNKLIHLLLRLCDDFILQASMWEVGNLLLTEKEELKTLCETLDSVMDWLTKTLNRVRAQPSGEHLARLLLRLDFNRWFSKKI
ncbi:PREDICTED: gamma-tubulin complex component 4 isoform X1 [Trachymyrmex septentrionalis]|uniref:gamma-tubulin complex component 4 isoform X1 n=1 Tax=Trachymyrmex septentrionalis TaxID=34720 RepID=UPI00084F3A09|nr:PREDICTED: gamma-tubulin complex component 4 isoform X1 [Trachymyrmex septentrionalis]